MKHIIVLKIKTFVLFLFPIIFLFSCSPSLPKTEPDLGMDIKILELNKIIKITAPKGANTFKLFKPMVIEIENLSDAPLEFRTNDIQIFQIQNGHWQKITYQQITNVDDLIIGQNEVNSTTGLILEPNGVFPGYKKVIPIMAEVNSDKPVFLRIYVFAHYEKSKNLSPNIVGSFVNVSLIP